MSNFTSARRSAFHKAPLILPAKTLLTRSGAGSIGVPGMDHESLGQMGIIAGMGGGARGYHAEGDVLQVTADGVDLNNLWGDYQRWLGQWNQARDTLVNFLTYNTTSAYEEVFQGGSVAEFEDATEYGEPVGQRPSSSGEIMGFPFKWRDLAGRFTWQFLADATAQQVDAFANMAQEADNRLVFLNVMRTLFTNTRSINKTGQTVYPFYSGQAGDKPADYKMTSFADSHNHFVTTGNATLTPVHLENLIQLIEEHGYTKSSGYNLVVLVNKAEGNKIRNFRSVPNGGTGLYDFVPAAGTPSFLLPTDLRTVGSQPSASAGGLTVIGGYGDASIVQEDYIPAGYMVAFVTGGEDNLSNPIAFREHPTASLRGLRLAKGKTPDYPLIDSFYVRGFGCGIRHRGAGAIMQVTASATYTVPSQYA